jgi:hypothetical protein
MLRPFRSVAWPTILATGLLFSVAPAFAGETTAKEALTDRSGTIAGWIVEGEARGELAHVDLALVLAIDVSKSITAEEHRLQLGGYATAFRSLAVLDAITGGANGSIAVTVLEWANTPAPLQAVGWTLISDAASAEALAAALEALPYRPLKGTSIGSAVDFSRRLFDSAPCISARRVIDISGDGESMDPSRLVQARSAAIRDGVTINGLPIRSSTEPNLPKYYGEAVIGGPGAFLVIAEGFTNFDQAILRKLMIEIAGSARRRTFDLARNQLTPAALNLSLETMPVGSAGL